MYYLTQMVLEWSPFGEQSSKLYAFEKLNLGLFQTAVRSIKEWKALRCFVLLGRCCIVSDFRELDRKSEVGKCVLDRKGEERRSKDAIE